MAVQIEVISEQLNGGFFLQISLTKDLKVTNIGHRVRPNILRADLEAGKNVTEEL